MIKDKRVGVVLEYIEKNYAGELSLKELASVGCLSEYHFSRIFNLHVGCSIAEYVRKVRIKNAQRLLTDSDWPIGRIATDVGYNTISHFNTAFKKEIHAAPREYRKTQHRNKSKESSNIEKAMTADSGDTPLISSFIRRIIEMNVTVEHLPDMEVAYLRRIGSYLETGSLWKRLMEWTERKNLSPLKNQFFGISYDEPEAADANKTTDACVWLPAGFDKSDEAVSYKTVKGGKFLLYKFYDTVDRLALVYKELVAEWLPTSAYDLDDRDFLEFTMNNPFTDPEGKCKIFLYVPVKDK